MEVSENVSMIATIPEVRRAMVMLQQKMPRDKGIVMDGRDIGTVVFPDADVKLFVVSDPKVRAERRYEELKAKGADVDFDSVLENIVSDPIEQAPHRQHQTIPTAIAKLHPLPKPMMR